MIDPASEQRGWTEFYARQDERRRMAHHESTWPPPNTFDPQPNNPNPLRESIMTAVDEHTTDPDEAFIRLTQTSLEHESRAVALEVELSQARQTITRLQDDHAGAVTKHARLANGVEQAMTDIGEGMLEFEDSGVDQGVIRDVIEEINRHLNANDAFPYRIKQPNRLEDVWVEFMVTVRCPEVVVMDGQDIEDAMSEAVGFASLHRFEEAIDKVVGQLDHNLEVNAEWSDAGTD